MEVPNKHSIQKYIILWNIGLYIHINIQPEITMKNTKKKIEIKKSKMIQNKIKQNTIYNKGTHNLFVLRKVKQ